MIILSRWSEVIDLISVESGMDADGFPSDHVETRATDLYVNKKDVRSSEFYQAASQGIRLETMFEIRSVDYGGQGLLAYQGTRFSIERTYDRGEIIELICQSAGDDHGR